MKDLIQLLKNERTLLSLNIGKLEKFMATEYIINLPANEQHLLTAQYGAMTAYHSILELRIKLLKDK